MSALNSDLDDYTCFTRFPYYQITFLILNVPNEPAIILTLTNTFKDKINQGKRLLKP